jgi:hypothetical protein
MDKDKSIIKQVAAKIAADLTINKASIAEFADNLDAVTELLMDSIYGGAGASTTTSDEANIVRAFPTATEQEFSVKVRNDQQGPLPSWLISACRRAGVTEVYDNRADLAANPKRPWFKAVNDKEKAYWPPKGA